MSNFALLRAVDDMLGTKGLVSLSTGVLWSAPLLFTGNSPSACRVAGVGAITAAFVVGNRVADYYMPLLLLTAFFEVCLRARCCAPMVQLPSLHTVPALLHPCAATSQHTSQGVAAAVLVTGKTAAGVAYFIGKAAAVTLLLAPGSSSYALLQPWTPHIFAATAALLAVGALESTPRRIYLYGFAGWVLALLTGQPAFAFHSWGFVGSLTQGVSHKVSREEPTMMQLTAGKHDAFQHHHSR